LAVGVGGTAARLVGLLADAAFDAEGDGDEVEADGAGGEVPDERKATKTHLLRSLRIRLLRPEGSAG
jgi:hypothetical protein